jgi:hypothetical protein
LDELELEPIPHDALNAQMNRVPRHEPGKGAGAKGAACKPEDKLLTFRADYRGRDDLPDP